MRLVLQWTLTAVLAVAMFAACGVSDLDGGAAAAGHVTVTWETENATAVEITVDGGAAAGVSAIGSTDVVVACDGSNHTITITPQSVAGPGEPQSEEVSG